MTSSVEDVLVARRQHRIEAMLAFDREVLDELLAEDSQIVMPRTRSPTRNRR
jgi:hypothetical protein